MKPLWLFPEVYLRLIDLGVLVARLDLPRGNRAPFALTCPRAISDAEISPQAESLLGSPSSHNTTSDQGGPFIWKENMSLNKF